MSPRTRHPNRRPGTGVRAWRRLPARAALLGCAAALGWPGAAWGAPCPRAADLPLLTIDQVVDPAVPVTDQWQVVWQQTPLSDAQLAALAGDHELIERTEGEMRNRGAWVFAGLGIAAAGAASSSAGWILYGQNELDQGITLPLAVGGLIVGVVGVLVATHQIQTPLEPHLAPTPVHRLTRDEARALVARINRRLHEEICAAANAAEAAEAAEVTRP